MKWPRDRHDDGSLLLSMLGVLMVSGLVVSLLALAINSQTRARSDRDYQVGILAADAGVQEALTEISLLSDLTTASLGETNVINGITYTWSATRTGALWEVQSQATNGDRTRKVEATVARSSRFIVGAFADVAFTMRGSNGADSYSHGSGATGTGNGSVGSNGSLTMLGNAFADRILLFGPDSSCTGNGCSTGELSGSATAFDIDAIAADIAAELADACPTANGWTASTGVTLVGGTTYCFSSLDFDVDTVLSGATTSNPVLIYLSGSMDMANNTEVNCAGCTTGSTPESGALQIYSTGTSVTIGNQGAIAMALAAPNASCHGSPSNAQAEIFGAMLCDDLSNQGGWNFHFDQDLASLGNGQWDISNWREELASTTGF